MTLLEFAERVATPALLAYWGLDDTPENRELLDALVDILTEEDTPK